MRSRQPWSQLGAGARVIVAGVPLIRGLGLRIAACLGMQALLTQSLGVLAVPSADAGAAVVLHSWPVVDCAVERVGRLVKAVEGRERQLLLAARAALGRFGHGIAICY